MTKHTPGPCKRCGSEYQSESVDFGLCCRCERDLIGIRVVGDHWANKAKAAPELLRGCNAALAYLATPRSKFKENREAAEKIISDAIAKAESTP